MKRPPYRAIHKRNTEQLARELEAKGLPAKRDGRYRIAAPDVSLGEAFVTARVTEKLRLYPTFERVAEEAGDLLPVLAHRRQGSGWLATVRLDDLAELLRGRAA